MRFYYFKWQFVDLETVVQFVYMNLHVHVEDSIIELVDTEDFSSLVGGHVNAPSFKIKGRHLGITTLYVSLSLTCYLDLHLSQISIDF